MGCGCSGWKVSDANAYTPLFLLPLEVNLAHLGKVAIQGKVEARDGVAGKAMAVSPKCLGNRSHPRLLIYPHYQILIYL